MNIRHPSGEHLVRVAAGHWIVYVFPYFLFTVLMGISLLLLALAATAASRTTHPTPPRKLPAMVPFFFVFTGRGLAMRVMSVRVYE